MAGTTEAGYSTAADAAEIGERFGDADLGAGRLRRGPDADRAGRVEEGARLLDEAMIAVTAGEVSPFITGIVYCGVIAGCQEASSSGARRSGRKH